MKHVEFGIQASFCDYLRKVHPNVLFISDTIGNVKLTINQASRNSRIQCKKFKCPDVVIFEPTEKYKGLFLEFKKSTPFKKDGVTLLSNEHVEAQQKSINDLLDRGYYACFVWSCDQAVEVLNNYLEGKL